MPGPISDSHKGPSDDAPYVPSWSYPNGKPKMCPCGHHEGYHNDKGYCLHRNRCHCAGLPTECFTTDEEFSNIRSSKTESE
jgi:hypothetical protein